MYRAIIRKIEYRHLRCEACTTVLQQVMYTGGVIDSV